VRAAGGAVAWSPMATMTPPSAASQPPDSSVSGVPDHEVHWLGHTHSVTGSVDRDTTWRPAALPVTACAATTPMSIAIANDHGRPERSRPISIGPAAAIA
jgi:hypothetical protein